MLYPCIMLYGLWSKQINDSDMCYSIAFIEKKASKLMARQDRNTPEAVERVKYSELPEL